MRDRDHAAKRRAGWPLALAALGALVCLGAASAPAHADSNFERGFEDQMGRIMAYEAVNLGKHILFQGVVHPGIHRGGHSHGYGYDQGYDQGYGHYARPTAYDYRRVPVHTHEHGKRPVRWSGHRDRHPGKHLGHFKHKRYDRHAHGHWRHEHHRGCRH